MIYVELSLVLKVMFFIRNFDWRFRDWLFFLLAKYDFAYWKVPAEIEQKTSKESVNKNSFCLICILFSVRCVQENFQIFNFRIFLMFIKYAPLLGIYLAVAEGLMMWVAIELRSDRSLLSKSVHPDSKQPHKRKNLLIFA